MGDTRGWAATSRARPIPCLQAAQMEREAGKGHSWRKHPQMQMKRPCNSPLSTNQFNLKHKPPFPFFLVVLLCFCGERKEAACVRHRLWERAPIWPMGITCLCRVPWESSAPMSGPEASCCVILRSFPRASELVLVLSSSRIMSIVYLEVIPPSSRGYSSETGKGRKLPQSVLSQYPVGKWHSVLPGTLRNSGE